MAVFTSTINGNWGDGATWGNASPGVAGVDYPGVNDDEANVSDDVTYDLGDSVVTFGDVTINNGGVLIMPTSSDSTFIFNVTAVFWVKNGGEFRAGTSVTPVNKANHCYVHWPHGVSHRLCWKIDDGAIVDIYGDPDFYGSTKYANLDSDWTAGQTLYVTGDLSAKWQAGQTFYIHENKVYVSYLLDGHTYTIATVGVYDAGNDRTPLTIVEAAPGLTFTAVHAVSGSQSELINVSRNIVLSDPTAGLSVGEYNTYWPRIECHLKQEQTNRLVKFNDVLMNGWYVCAWQTQNYWANNVTYVNNRFGLFECENSTVNGDFISNLFPVVQCEYTKVTGNLVSNYEVTSYSLDTQIIGNLVGNYAGTWRSNSNRIAGDLISNYYGIHMSNNSQVIGNFFNNFRGINYGINVSAEGNFRGNTNNVSNASTRWRQDATLEQCKIDGTQRPLRVYLNSGNFLPLMSGESGWQIPPSGLDWILQATPNEWCNAIQYTGIMPLSPLRDISDEVRAGVKTLTFKIYPVDWTTPLSQDDIYIEARYLSEASGNNRVTIATPVGTFANDAWRDLTVTFTPGQNGILYFNLYLKKYELNCYVLIDPEWSIA